MTYPSNIFLGSWSKQMICLDTQLFSQVGKKIILSIIFMCAAQLLKAQVPNVPSTTTEQQLEAVTEGNEDTETQDDTFLQQLQQFLKTPLNLNYADAASLKELVILTPIQIQNLISYRNLFGNFINIYEIQAVPGWDVQTIEKIRPYISVNARVDLVNSLGERLHNGNHSVLMRVTQVLENSRGLKADPSAGNSYYPGSPQRILFRYKYQYKNLLQYGLVGDKDAGEQFFKGNQKSGFDFYSFHAFARNIGIIKSIAVGDLMMPIFLAKA